MIELGVPIEDILGALIAKSDKVLIKMKALTDLSESDKKGCFVSVIIPEKITHTSYLTFAVGIIDNEKAKRYKENSIEKPLRTIKNKHTTSFKSRRPEAHHFGGGFFVRKIGIGIGVSGFTEAQDMVFGLTLAVESGLIEKTDALAIANYVPEGYQVYTMMKKILGYPPN